MPRNIAGLIELLSVHAMMRLIRARTYIFISFCVRTIFLVPTIKCLYELCPWICLWSMRMRLHCVHTSNRCHRRAVVGLNDPENQDQPEAAVIMTINSGTFDIIHESASCWYASDSLLIKKNPVKSWLIQDFLWTGAGAGDGWSTGRAANRGSTAAVIVET